MYNVDISSHSNNFQCTIQVENHSGEKIAEFNNCEETMNLKDVNFWWPYLMDPKVRWSIFLIGRSFKTIQVLKKEKLFIL